MCFTVKCLHKCLHNVTTLYFAKEREIDCGKGILYKLDNIFIYIYIGTALCTLQLQEEIMFLQATYPGEKKKDLKSIVI